MAAVTLGGPIEFCVVHNLLIIVHINYAYIEIK